MGDAMDAWNALANGGGMLQTPDPVAGLQLGTPVSDHERNVLASLRSAGNRIAADPVGGSAYVAGKIPGLLYNAFTNADAPDGTVLASAPATPGPSGGLLGAAEAEAAPAANALTKFNRMAPTQDTDLSLKAWNAHIAPHFTEDEFAKQYLGGYDGPTQTLYDASVPRFELPSGKGARHTFSTTLFHPETGEAMGEMDRTLFPQVGYAKHDYFELYPNAPAGTAREMLKNQVDVYDKMGINTIGTHANIDTGNGGYTWAKYGFHPEDGPTWRQLKTEIQDRADELLRSPDDVSTYAGSSDLGSITKEDHARIRDVLRSKDPKAIWKLADDTTPTGALDDNGKPMTVGKAVLLGQSWGGKLDLTPGSLSRERFDRYVGR